MRTSEVMTKNIVCCIRTLSVMNAARMLRQFDIGLLVVVDDPETRKLIGVVTDRDLCLTLAEMHDPTLTTVEDCMTWDPVYCTADTGVREALAIMAERQVHRIPVADNAMRVQGVLSLTDLIQHDAVSPPDVVRALSRITTPPAMAGEEAARSRRAGERKWLNRQVRQKMMAMRVSEIMTIPVTFCRESFTVQMAVGLMKESDSGFLPVLSELGQELVGAVTDRDLCLKVLAEGSDPSQVRISEFMTPDPVFCAPNTNVQQVLATMAERQVRRIPVFDKRNGLQGLVSLVDLTRHAAVGAKDIYRALVRITASKARAHAAA